MRTPAPMLPALLPSILPPIHVSLGGLPLAVTALQCANLMACANEIQSPTQYSKFAEKVDPKSTSTVSSRMGMLIIYAPAAVVALASIVLAGPASNERAALVGSLMLIHFLKRLLEVVFVHRYSGSVGLAVSCFIGTFYACVSALVLTMQSSVPQTIYEAPGSALALSCGLIAFVIGQAGNLYHHVILSEMRKPASDAAADTACRYVVPSGGLFDMVTMPHYLFEIVAWVGIALCTQQLNALLAAAGMASYLSGRAVATTRWYQDKFGEAWPSSRRHLIPGIF